MVVQIFQKIFNQMGNSLLKVVGVLDSSHKVVASTCLEEIGKEFSISLDSKQMEAQGIYTDNNVSCKVLGNKQIGVWYAYCRGNDDISKTCVSILSSTLNEAIRYYTLKYDKCSFIRDIVIDNILQSDISLRQRELKISDDVLRICILVRSIKLDEYSLFEVLQNLFPDKEKDFVIKINSSDVIIIKDIKETTSNEDLGKLAASLLSTLANDYCIKCIASVGSAVRHLKHLAKSYKNAQMAIEVRKIFGNKSNVALYNQLGLPRLVYQLPETLCRDFLNEVFKKSSVDSIDEELVFTINKFFENSLNVSETSRELFVHRNTLVYRIEKIEKITGLNIRKFEDAIIFKIAFMINRYLKERPVKY